MLFSVVRAEVIQLVEVDSICFSGKEKIGNSSLTQEVRNKTETKMADNSFFIFLKFSFHKGTRIFDLQKIFKIFIFYDDDFRQYENVSFGNFKFI